MTIPVGISIRNMGDQSTPATMARCAREAEQAGLHSIWVADHIAIPPDDAEGSGGRYLDPLATLAWLGGQTSKIMLSTGVLVLPYRPKLATAKWVATIQELTAGRLILGVGIGWMKPEFDVVGVPVKDRARVSEETLAFLNEAFANDVVSAGGQDFLFRPRPPRPPILVGGTAPHAVDRAVRLGDGWFPIPAKPEVLAPQIAAYKDAAAATGESGLVYTYAPYENRSAFRDRVSALEDIGVDVVIASGRYADADDFSRKLEAVAAAIG